MADPKQAPPAGGKTVRTSGMAAEVYSKYGVFLILVLMLIAGVFVSPRFATWENILSVLNQVSIIACLACGMSMVIISSNVDLAAGSGVAVASVICTMMMHRFDSAPLSILITLAFGMLFGVVSGFFVSFFGLNPFIVTLAMQFILRGVAYILSTGSPILNVGSVAALAGSFGTIPRLPLIVMGVTLLIWFVLSYTVYGRQLYAIGGNREAARASGIRVKWNIFVVYVIMGVITAFAGVLYAARTNSGLPAGAQAYEFDAIIACVLGGVSMSGGVGIVGCSVAGAMVVGIINNCMNLVGVNAYYQQIVKGVIILAAVLLDKKTREKIMRTE